MHYFFYSYFPIELYKFQDVIVFEDRWLDNCYSFTQKLLDVSEWYLVPVSAVRCLSQSLTQNHKNFIY